MSEAKISSALVQAFLAGNFFDAAHVQFENLAFEPPTNGAPWAALYFVPASVSVATLGAGGSDLHEGFFQIDLNFPLNKGTKAVADMADNIGITFTAGRGFLYSGQEVKISSCGRSQGRNVSGFFRVSVTAYWYAHVTRNI